MWTRTSKTRKRIIGVPWNFSEETCISLSDMESASLGLAGGRGWSLATEALPVDGDRMTALRTPMMQENQLLREKTTSTCSNAVHAQFHWLAYTRNSRPCDVVCLKSIAKHFRSIAGMIAPHVHTSTRSIAIEVKHKTLLANRARLLDRTRRRSACTAFEDARTNLHPRTIQLRCRRQANLKHFVDRCCSTALHCTSTVPARGSRCSNGHCSRLSSTHLVMIGNNARRPRTGRERGRWWRLSEASDLTVWTLNDRFFASLVHCMLRRWSPNTGERKLKNRKFFCGVVGLDGRCSAQAEQRKKNP